MTEFSDIIDPSSEETSDLLNTLSKKTQCSKNTTNGIKSLFPANGFKKINEEKFQCSRCLKKLHPKNFIHTCTPHKDWKDENQSVTNSNHLETE